MSLNYRMLRYVENTLEMLRDKMSTIDIQDIQQNIDIVYEYTDALIDHRKLYCKLDIPLDNDIYDDLIYSLHPEIIMYAFRNFIHDVNNNKDDFTVEELVNIYGFNNTMQSVQSSYIDLCKIAAQDIINDSDLDPLMVKAGVYIIVLSGFNSNKYKKIFDSILFDLMREYNILWEDHDHNRPHPNDQDLFISAVKCNVISYANDLTNQNNIETNDYFVNHPDRLMF